MFILCKNGKKALSAKETAELTPQRLEELFKDDFYLKKENEK